MNDATKHSDQESGLERICGILALLFWSVLLIEVLGITIIVGVSDVTPRTAALIMLVPALAAWVLGSRSRLARLCALAAFPPFGWW